jgi:hypothetical protein
MTTDHQVTEPESPPEGRLLGMIFTALIAMGSLAVVVFFASR